MTQGNTPITIVGNLVADPELRFIPNGAAVTNFRIASTPRVYNRETNKFEDGDALFMTCNCWRGMAENVAESLTKGMRVIVTGNLKQRSFQTKEGDQRTVYEIDVQDVGPSLRYATAQVARNPRDGGAPQGGAQQPPKPTGWTVQDKNAGFGGGSSNNTWGEPAPTGTAKDDTPPF